MKKNLLTYVGALPARPGEGVHHPNPDCPTVRRYNYSTVPMWLAERAGLAKCQKGCK